MAGPLVSAGPHSLLLSLLRTLLRLNEELRERTGVASKPHGWRVLPQDSPTGLFIYK